MLGAIEGPDTAGGGAVRGAGERPIVIRCAYCVIPPSSQGAPANGGLQRGVAYRLRDRMLAELLPEGENWALETESWGKPVVRRPQGRDRAAFNLSHTAGMVACAVGLGCDLGVDVEPIGRDHDHDGLARRFFTRLEADRLARTPRRARARRFISIWTCKEAVTKTLGTGLRMPLDSFSIDLTGPRIQWEASAEASAGWGLFQRHRKAHVISLAVRTGACTGPSPQVHWSEERFASLWDEDGTHLGASIRGPLERSVATPTAEP